MNVRSERAAALVLAMIAVFLAAALAASLAVLAHTELKIAANWVDGAELRYTADAALEAAIEELGTIPDWSEVLSGAVLSRVIDGSPGGQRTLSDGSVIDLDDLNGQASADNPSFRLFAFAPAHDLQPGGNLGYDRYVLVWAGDDPEQDPAILVIRSEALGPAGMRHMLAARVLRTPSGAVRVVSWQELR